MEIDFNPSRVPKAEPSQPASRPDATAAATDGVSFAVTSALQEKLKNLPSTRPEKVALGKILVSDSKYPPSDVMDRIAVLLAVQVKQ
jgi:hypothetical protein